MGDLGGPSALTSSSTRTASRTERKNLILPPEDWPVLVMDLPLGGTVVMGEGGGGRRS